MTSERLQTITPGVIGGTLRVPPSKSITHRALIIAALSGTRTRVQRILQAEDTQLTLQALQQLGFEFTAEADWAEFKGQWRPPAQQPVQLWVGNSGTTARLLTAVAALLPLKVIIDGSPRMRQRPMAPLVQALQQLGVPIEHHDGNLPLQIQGGAISASSVTIDPRISSQFVSGLMLIAPALPGGLTLHLTHTPSSQSYIELTRKLMQQFGITVEWQENYISVLPGRYQLPEVYTVEGDFSSASYFLIGSHLSGGQVTVKGMTMNSPQGDKEIVPILKAAGARIREVADGIQVKGTATIKPIDWQMQHCPDLVPGVAVMCAFAAAPSYLRQVEHLRYKESDRIAAVTENLQRLGAMVHYQKGTLIIEPQPLRGAVIRTFDDHRIAMAFALAGLRIPGVKIANPECVGKSYPSFWEDWQQLVQTDKVRHIENDS